MKRLPGHIDFVKPCCKNCYYFEKTEVYKRGKRFTEYKCKIYKRMVHWSGIDYPVWCKDKFREVNK